MAWEWEWVEEEEEMQRILGFIKLLKLKANYLQRYVAVVCSGGWWQWFAVAGGGDTFQR